jgi:hypothetical protein
VNERPYDYWRGLFRERGLVAVDCVRPLVAGDPTVSPWYRYNVLLYLRPEILARTSEYLRLFRLDDKASVPDVAPRTYQLRRAMVRSLPRAVQNGLARALAHRYGRHQH